MRRAFRSVIPYVLIALALFLVWMSASCTSPEPGPGERPLAVWSEFMTDDQVRDAFGLVSEEGADLYLAIPSQRIGDPALADLLVDAADADVGVRAWLLLPEEDGYWPNEHNVEAFGEAAHAFVDWRDEADLPVDWIVFDMEMGLDRTRQIEAAIRDAGTLAALDQIRDGRDPEAFEEARQAFSDLVGALQARGMKVMSVTYPTILDDGEDGDDDIQDEMDVPIVGIGWDQSSFMVYQSLIYDLSGEWHGPDVVESYADSAVDLFGGRAAVALGIVGNAGITNVEMPYPDAQTLLDDQAAAKSAGVPISIYSLDGLMAQTDPGAWLDREIPPSDPEYATADALRRLIRGLLD